MKAKLVWSIIIIASLFISCGPSAEEQTKQAYKEAITNLLMVDGNLEYITKHDPSLQAVAMRKLDLSKCPPDFSAAYVDHLHAWEDLARIDKALKQLSSDENIASLLTQEAVNELLETNESPILDAVELENKLNERKNLVSENILLTFREVERIAVTYGATLPK